jgi:integrase
LATWLDRQDVELEIIQKILGHEDPDMTLHYIDPDFKRIENAFENMWKNIRLTD